MPKHRDKPLRPRDPHGYQLTEARHAAGALAGHNTKPVWYWRRGVLHALVAIAQALEDVVELAQPPRAVWPRTRSSLVEGGVPLSNAGKLGDLLDANTRAEFTEDDYAAAEARRAARAAR